MKASRILIIIVAVIIIIPVLGFVTWYIKRGNELEIFFVNKSMTHYKGTENKSFNWILNNRKILRPGKAMYKMEVNYYGLHFDGKDSRVVYPRLKDIDRLIEKTNLIYYADVSGIPSGRLGTLEDIDEERPIYGGFNNTDYILSKKAISAGKKYIAECNYFGYPTEPLMRYNIEQFTDVYWLGWIGKYVPDLSVKSDNDLCYDYVDSYVNTTGQSWDFTGPGLILIDRTRDRVVVLREGNEVNISGGFIHASEEAVDRFNLPLETCYNGWFSMLHPGKNKVLCTFDLKPSEEGMVILKSNGLPESFPALIQRNSNFYFLAGDFGKSNVNICFSRIFGINNIIDAVKRRSPDNPSNFFYTFYKPLIAGILDETIMDSRESEQ